MIQQQEQEPRLCKCCQKAEVAGYIGNGVIITDLCAKCYRKHGEQIPGRAYKHITRGQSQ